MVGLATSADSPQAAQMGLVSALRIIDGYEALHRLKINREESYARLKSINKQNRTNC